MIEAAQFADYVWPAMEQIVDTSHDYYRSNGQFVPNIVMRLASGGYIGGRTLPLAEPRSDLHDAPGSPRSDAGIRG